MLLSETFIPKYDVYDLESGEGKKFMIADDINELSYTELILLIDDKNNGAHFSYRVQVQGIC